jgi:hypothetical protein
MRKNISLLATCLACLLPVVASGASIATPLQMVGSIDSHYAIRMAIEQNAGQIKGTYRYLPKGHDLALEGTIDPAGNIALNEADEKGKKTGAFKGRIVDGKRIVGTWTRVSDKQAMPFLVALENSGAALDAGKDGIIITEKTGNIPKSKTNPGRDPSTVSYPIVMKQALADQAVAGQLQESLSPDRAWGVKNIIRDALSGTDTWTEEIDYAVKYNRNYLLDVEFNMSGCGAYPDSSSKQVVINTKTGKRVTAADAFNKASMPELKRLASAAMKQAVNTAAKEHSSDKEEAASFAELMANQQLKMTDLNNFAIDDKGITFLYDWGFPHAAEGMEPSGEFFVPYTKLATIIRKDGPLAVFLATK